MMFRFEDNLIDANFSSGRWEFPSGDNVHYFEASITSRKHISKVNQPKQILPQFDSW